MGKRFTDSEKFRDIWYRKLNPIHKCLWEFIISECDYAGMLEVDFDSMSFHIGSKITNKDLSIFDNRIIFLREDLIFIPKFITFQQPNGLNSNNNAHKNIISKLDSYNIDLTQDFKHLKSTLEAPSQELPSSPSNGIGIGKGLSKVKEEVSKKGFGEFENVMLTKEEYENLQNLYKSKFVIGINILSDYIESSGKKYKSHYATMKKDGWVYEKAMKSQDKIKVSLAGRT